MSPSDATEAKQCRAFACVKRIPDDAIFCAVHRNMIAPTRYAAPIVDNREPPAGAPRGVVRRILSGTHDAVAWIAAQEGRSAAYAEARRRGSIAQAGGSGANPDPLTGGGGASAREVTVKIV